MRIAQAAKWAELRYLAGKIRLGKDMDTSYLAVPGHWEVQIEVPIKQMATDLGGEIYGYPRIEGQSPGPFLRCAISLVTFGRSQNGPRPGAQR